MRSGGWIENRKKEQGTSTYRLITKSVGRVRKPNVSDTENGSAEAVSASIQELAESRTTATTIGAQGRISCTDCEWFQSMHSPCVHTHPMAQLYRSQRPRVVNRYRKKRKGAVL